MVNTTLCYIEKNNSYLMLKRNKKENDLNKDKWIGIGGKFESGESPEDCVLREVKEETGLTLNTFEYKGIITFVSDSTFTEYMHLFYSKDYSGELIDCDEGELHWISKEKINDLPHWKGDEIFISLLQKKVPFFSLKLVYENGTLISSVLNNQKIN